MDEKKISNFVLNDFLKFERKIYSLFGYNIGRAIYFRTIVYVVLFGLFFFLLSKLPLFNLLPLPVYLVLTIVTAYILTDTGTENRSPISFLSSVVRYHLQQLRGDTYYKGRVITKQRTVKFQNLATVKDPVKPKEKEEKGYRVKRGVNYR